MNIQGITVRKSRGESLFLVIAFLSALLSVTVISAAPLYFEAIEQLGLRRTLERFTASHMGSWIHVEEMTFNGAAIKSTVQDAESAGAHLGDTIRESASFVRSGSLTLKRINDQFAPLGSALAYQSVEGVNPAVSLVTGAFPSDSPSAPLEIAVLEHIALEYGIDVGDSLLLTAPPTELVHTTPIVSGIFRIDDQEHETWLGLSSTLIDPVQGPTGGRPPIIALTSNAMMERVANRGIADVGQLWMMFYVDLEELERVGASKYLEVITRFRMDAAKLLPSSASFSGIESALFTLQRQLTFANTTTIIAGALFAAFAVFVLALNLSIIARRWMTEGVMLKVRGADRNQLLQSIGLYLLILFVMPAVLGPLLASVTVPVLGLFGSFQELTGGNLFRFMVLPEQFIWSGIVALILLPLFAVPLMLDQTSSIVRNFTRLRDSRSPWFWRANLDIGIVIAAGAMIFELNGRGSLFVEREDGVSGFSILAISLPIVTLIAASLVALRLFHFTGILFERLSRVNIHSMVALALKVLSRSTMNHAVLMLLAAGTTIVVINASGLSETLGRNTSDRIDFSTASEMLVSGIDGFKTSDNEVVSEIVGLEWVDEATWGVRVEARTGRRDSSSDFTMLAVRPDEFTGAVKLRADFADEPLDQLMSRITVYSATGSLPIPDDVAMLEAAVKLRRIGKGRIDIWTRLLDGNGTTHTIRMTPENGGLSGNRWHHIAGNISSGLVRPLRLLAIEVYEPPTSQIGSAVKLTIDSIRAENLIGTSTLVSDFSDAGPWHPMTTSIDDDARLLVVDEGINGSEDSMSLEIEMGRGIDDGVRGIYYSDEGPISVPLLVNAAFLNNTDLMIGDGFAGHAYGRFIPFEIRGVFDLFPTMKDENRPFAVTNVDALLSYLMPVSEPFLSNSAELFIALDENVPYDQRIADIKRINPSLRVADNYALHAESSTRLGDAAGWRIVGALIATSAAVIAVIAAVGITFHNLDLNRRDATLIESLGGSRLGVAIEAATRILISLYLGFALGLVGGIYSVQFIADRMTRTSTGEIALPPMVLQIDWLPIVGAMILLVAATLMPTIWDVIRPKETIAVRIRSLSRT